MLESIGVQDGRGNGHRHRQTPNDGHVRFGEARQGGMGAYAFNIGPFNLEAVAFDLGLEGGNRPARPPTPKYEPPTAAEPGFTRSPGEDDVVVCPNCGDELAMGEDDLKQEIWVIKKCGHVSGIYPTTEQDRIANQKQAYCGVCTQNRTKAAASRSKGKGKAREVIPFNKCVVKDCDSSASAKSMVHVYLGS
jgi:pre-mRNA-processing factor 19